MSWPSSSGQPSNVVTSRSDGVAAEAGRRVCWNIVSAPEPQPILSHPTEAAIFLVLTVPSGSEAGVPEVLADVAGIKRSVGFRVPEAELSCVVGIGAVLWDRLGVGLRPAGLHPFRELTGPRHT